MVRTRRRQATQDEWVDGTFFQLGSLDAVLLLAPSAVAVSMQAHRCTRERTERGRAVGTYRIDHMCFRRARCSSVIGTVLSSLSSLDGRADWC